MWEVGAGLPTKVHLVWRSRVAIQGQGDRQGRGDNVTGVDGERCAYGERIARHARTAQTRHSMGMMPLAEPSHEAR
jgi:hypothetical protein